ncbi:hypothetical protein ACFY00_14645 [Kitasatospora sp. NPDC001540]
MAMTSRCLCRAATAVAPSGSWSIRNSVLPGNTAARRGADPARPRRYGVP